jgi:hypothetical protein
VLPSSWSSEPIPRAPLQPVDTVPVMTTNQATVYRCPNDGEALKDWPGGLGWWADASDLLHTRVMYCDGCGGTFGHQGNQIVPVSPA